MSDPILDALNSAASRPDPSQPAVDPIAAALQQAANASPQAAAAPSPSPSIWDTARGYLDEAGRQIGLTARAGVKGVLAIPGMVADVPSAVYNAAADAVAGQGNGYRFPTTQAALDSAMNRVGLPQPQNALERVVGDATAAMAGTGGALGAAGYAANSAVSPAARATAELLRARPTLQAVSSATGAGAAGTTRELGYGPGAQLAAGLLGATIPVAGAGAIDWARTGLGVTPANAQNMKDTIDAFQAAGGTTPSLGQATGNRTAQAVESTLAKLPGGAGPMAAKANDTLARAGGAVDQMADALSPTSGVTEAGDAIKQGMIGDQPDSWLSMFRAQSRNLYSKLDQYLPNKAPVEVSNTKAALDQLTADIQGAPALSDVLRNSKIAGIREAFNADTAAQQDAAPQLSWNAVKQLRSMIGEKLEGFHPVDDITRAQWSRLYGALSQDMEAAANNAGPQAANAYSAASGFYKAGMDKLDLVSSVLRSDIPEKVYQATTATAKNGPTVVQNIMDSLPPDAQRTVTATFLKNLGRAAPGQQNATADAFSLESFLTRWNGLNPDAKAALFQRSGYPADFSDNLDKIVRVAQNLRDGSKVFSNPSGTSQGIASTSVAGQGATALSLLLTGHPLAAAGVAGGLGVQVGGANAIAKWMTNPDAVRRLAQAADQPTSSLPGLVNSLAQISANQQTGSGTSRKPAAAAMPPAVPAGAPQSRRALLGQLLEQRAAQ